MIEDPLTTVFNIESNTDIQEYQETTEGAIATVNNTAEKDAEDIIIDKNIDEVYNLALSAYKDQTEMIQIIEPRYMARNAEVAANYLNIALNAISTRAKVKGDRKRTETFVPYQNKFQQNVVVANRETLLQMLSIDNEMKEIK